MKVPDFEDSEQAVGFLAVVSTVTGVFLLLSAAILQGLLLPVAIICYIVGSILFLVGVISLPIGITEGNMSFEWLGKDVEDPIDTNKE
jgi:hypothetical protein